MSLAFSTNPRPGCETFTHVQLQLQHPGLLSLSHEADDVLPLQYAAAKYYRLAENNGNKTLGNSW